MLYTPTVYQFHGDFWHGCSTCKTPTDINPVNNKTFQELREHTQNITNYLRETLKLTVIEMWECEWDREKKENPEIQRYLEETLYNTRNKIYNGLIHKKSILDAPWAEKLFGLVQFSIHVPDKLKEKISEMQPIFKNTVVSRNDIGEFMKAYADKHKLLTQPRKSLIGSYFGTEILLITTLLKWYLEHELVVTDIQQVIEFTPSTCFKNFGETVSNARRSGDADKNKENHRRDHETARE